MTPEQRLAAKLTGLPFCLCQWRMASVATDGGVKAPMLRRLRAVARPRAARGKARSCAVHRERPQKRRGTRPAGPARRLRRVRGRRTRMPADRRWRATRQCRAACRRAGATIEPGPPMSSSQREDAHDNGVESDHECARQRGPVRDLELRRDRRECSLDHGPRHAGVPLEGRLHAPEEHHAAGQCLDTGHGEHQRPSTVAPRTSVTPTPAHADRGTPVALPILTFLGPYQWRAVRFPTASPSRG